MKNFHLQSVRVAVIFLAMVFAGALARPAAAQVADPGNFLFTQSPSASVFLHSYLVGFQPKTNGVVFHAPFTVNGKMPTYTFNTMIGNALNPAGVAAIHDADFFFQECYGGGMIADLPSALGTIPWVAGSASTYAQVALATPQPAFNVQPQYATWSVPLVNQLFTNPNQTILNTDKFALANDSRGPNAGVFYRETPQYASYNAGNNLTLTDAPVDALGGQHLGVIFVGDTSTLNQSMINVTVDMITTLTNAWAGKPFKISILFGDGAGTAGVTTASGKNLSQKITAFNATAPANESISLAPGTPAQLQTTLNTLGNTNKDQFLFFGFDHGGSYRTSKPTRTVRTQVAGAGPAVTTTTWTDSFSLEDPTVSDPNPNPNGELVDTMNEEDITAPPTISIEYSGLDPAAAQGSVDVLVNGTEVGTLDPTSTLTVLPISASLLQDTNTLTINDNSGLNVNILDDYFDSGALPPEEDPADVPEPASAAVLLVAMGLLARRRR